MATKAYLDIEGARAEVITFSYSFSRETDDRKGKPVTTTSSGRIKISLYSEAQDMIGQVLDWLHKGEMKAEAKVEIMHDNHQDGSTVLLKTVTFKHAYVVDYQENFNSYDQNSNMIESFEIAAEIIEVVVDSSGATCEFGMEWA